MGLFGINNIGSTEGRRELKALLINKSEEFRRINFPANDEELNSGGDMVGTVLASLVKKYMRCFSGVKFSEFLGLLESTNKELIGICDRFKRGDYITVQRSPEFIQFIQGSVFKLNDLDLWGNRTTEYYRLDKHVKILAVVTCSQGYTFKSYEKNRENTGNLFIGSLSLFGSDKCGYLSYIFNDYVPRPIKRMKRAHKVIPATKEEIKDMVEAVARWYK